METWNTIEPNLNLKSNIFFQIRGGRVKLTEQDVNNLLNLHIDREGGRQYIIAEFLLAINLDSWHKQISGNA